MSLGAPARAVVEDALGADAAAVVFLDGAEQYARPSSTIAAYCDLLRRYVAEGARVVLVGEALVKEGDPRAAVASMTGLEGTGTTP